MSAAAIEFMAGHDGVEYIGADSELRGVDSQLFEAVNEDLGQIALEEDYWLKKRDALLDAAVKVRADWREGKVSGTYQSIQARQDEFLQVAYECQQLLNERAKGREAASKRQANPVNPELDVAMEGVMALLQSRAA